jgi:hypothetical protein
MRNLSEEVKEQFTGTGFKPAYLYELYLDSGTVRAWTGVGEIIYNGNTYYGTGIFGAISDVEESQETKSSTFQAQLSGIPTEMASIALNEHYKGRKFIVYLAAMGKASETDTKDSILGADIFAQGIVDTMNFVDSGTTSTLTLAIAGGIIRILKPRLLRYTNADQQMLFPGDRGLEYIPGLQNKTTLWGKSS